MTTTTSAGSTLHFSAAIPATEDAAGYAALTYTKVGGVESIGALGAATGVVNFQPLDGALQKHKGSTNYGSLQPPIAYDKADAGQTLMRTLAEPTNNALCSGMVVYANGDKRYFQSRIFGWPETVGNADSMLMANPTVEICSKIVKVDAA